MLAPQNWLSQLPGWNDDTDKGRRLSRVSEGRAVLTHVSGEIEYPTVLAADPVARGNIRRGLLASLNELGRGPGSSDSESILPVAVFDHFPDRLNDRRNIHCHFLIGTRRATIDEEDNLAFAENKVDAITRMGFVERLRGTFAELVNVELEHIAADHRLHPGTHAEMGIHDVTANRKLAGRAIVLERAGVPTGNGLFNDVENWRRGFDRASERHVQRRNNVEQGDGNALTKALRLQATVLRHEAEQIGLLIGMSVSRAKRTLRYAPEYALTAKRERDSIGWRARAQEARDHLTALDRDLRAERAAVAERRREAVRLDRTADQRDAQEQAQAQEQQQVRASQALRRAAAHRAADLIARTPLLLTERDGFYEVERSDDPAKLIAGIDLNLPEVQKRLRGQHAAQRKAVAQVRSFLHKHGDAALFDEDRIGRSAWLRSSVEQWRSSPIIAREEAERRERADAHRSHLNMRNMRWRAQRPDDLDALAADGRIAFEPALPVTDEVTLVQPTPTVRPVPIAEPIPLPAPLLREAWSWRPGPSLPIPPTVSRRWKAEGMEQFAIDSAAFEHVLAERPHPQHITDPRLVTALGSAAARLTQPGIYHRLVAVWLYQEATRRDLLATSGIPHYIPHPEPLRDPAIGRSALEVLADRTRHENDAVLGLMFDQVERGERALPTLPVRNRLLQVALAAISTGEDSAVCRLLADAAIDQTDGLAKRRCDLSDVQDALLRGASSMPLKGINRARPGASRKRGLPRLAPPNQPGRR